MVPAISTTLAGAGSAYTGPENDDVPVVVYCRLFFISTANPGPLSTAQRMYYRNPGLMRTHVGIVPIVDGVVHVRCRGGAMDPVTEAVVRARHQTKIQRQVAGRPDDAPVVIAGDEDLPFGHGSAGKLESGRRGLERDDLLLSQRGHRGRRQEKGKP